METFEVCSKNLSENTYRTFTNQQQSANVRNLSGKLVSKANLASSEFWNRFET